MSETSGNERVDGRGLEFVQWPAAEHPMEIPISIKGTRGATSQEPGMLGYRFTRFTREALSEAILEWVDPHVYLWEGDRAAKLAELGRQVRARLQASRASREA